MAIRNPVLDEVTLPIVRPLILTLASERPAAAIELVALTATAMEMSYKRASSRSNFSAKQPSEYRPRKRSPSAGDR